MIAAFDAQPKSLGAVAALREALIATAHVEPADRPRRIRLGRILASAPALGGRAHAERLSASDALIERVAKRLGVAADDVRPRTVVTAMMAVAAEEYFSWAEVGSDDDPSQRMAAAFRVLELGFTSRETKSGSKRKA